MIPGVPSTQLSSGSVDSSNSWAPTFSRAGKTVTRLKMLFTGWCAGNPVDILCPNPYTIKASIEYPIGAAPQVLTWAGATSKVINPGENILTDAVELTTPIPHNARFRVRTYVTVATGGKFPVTRPAVGNAGLSSAVADQGNGLPDLTQGTTAPTTNTTLFLPAAILCEDPVGPDTVAILGDSIAAGQSGTNDFFDADPNYGGFARAFNGRPIINTARPSQSPEQQTASALAYKLDFFDKAGVTLVLNEHGTNAFNLADPYPANQAMLEVFAARGFKTVQTTRQPLTGTITPRQRFDSSAQTPSQLAKYLDYNAKVRLNSAPLLTFIETALGGTESGTYSGCWADWIHDARSQLTAPSTFTVGSGSTTTVVVSATSVGSNNFWNNGGGAVEFLTGALAGQWFDPTSNTSTTVTVSSAMPSTPVAGDTFRLHVPRTGSAVADGLHPAEGGHRIIRDAVKVWVDSYFGPLP